MDWLITVHSFTHLFSFLDSRSTGFILEGFPKTSEEAVYIGEQGLFPDSAIILAVEDTDVIARLLPPKLQKWKERRDRRNEKKQRIKEKKQKKRVRSMSWILIDCLLQYYI